MSKPKRTQRSTTGANGAKPATGAARSTTRATGSVAAVGTTSRPASSSISSTSTVRSANTASARATGTTTTRATGTSTTTRPASANRMQARAAYAKNRRRGVALPWWRSSWAIIGAPIVAVLMVVVILVIAANRGGATVSNGQPAPVNVLHGVTAVSDKTFATVNTGEVPNPFTAVTPGVPIMRDSAGKPIMLYVGAEYCPYCAAERWPMVMALSRFGTFSNLHIISSSSTDAYPNTPTFTFYKSTYSSPYLDFQPVEVQDRVGNVLQAMTPAQSKLFSQYNTNQSFPFIDVGNQFVAIGASYQNTVLTGQDWNSIAALLNNPSSKVTQSIVGTANYMTAAICQITGNKPANVCTAAPIPSIEKTIGKPAGS